MEKRGFICSSCEQIEYTVLFKMSVKFRICADFVFHLIMKRENK